MIRFLEENGYDVSYVSRLGSRLAARSLLLNHKLFISSGHDEYWSGNERANVQAALNAGVNLAFFSGNEMFWKTRWAASQDGSNTPYRTLITYKETHFNGAVDPQDPPIWTGTWGDSRFNPARRRRLADKCPDRPAVRGQFRHGRHHGPLPVQPRLRLWRNTAAARLDAPARA